MGQAEVEIASAADSTVVLVVPGMGDSIQAAKAGVLEVADVLVVNKADRPDTQATLRDLRAMVALAQRRVEAADRAHGRDHRRGRRGPARAA